MKIQYRVKNCCGSVELRKGCIIMAVVGIVLSIIAVGVTSAWSTIISLILAFPATCCLLYSAAYTKGSEKSRCITALIYQAYVVLSALLLAINAVVVLFNWIQSTEDIPHGQYAVALAILIGLTLLDLYFNLIAYSWYLDLKGVVVVGDVVINA